MTKNYCNNKALHEKIMSGVTKLADNVASTLGPRGRNVILCKNGARPIITKDGVTVAEFVDLQDPFENVAAQIVKQAASETNNVAGDGTTTSTVLCRAILEEAQKMLSVGISPVELKRGMDKAVDEICRRLDDMSIPVMSKEDIAHVATISANGDREIGNLIAMAVDKTGKDGAITIEKSNTTETHLDMTEGFRFDSGYFAKAFVTDKRRGTISYEDALLLVTDHKLDNLDDLLPVLEIVAREGRPFIVVAEEVEGQALAALIMNTVRGTMRVAAVKAPRYGNERRNILQDLCVSTGGTFVSRLSGKSLKDVKLADLGRMKKVEVNKNFTTIVDGSGDWEKVEERIEELKNELKITDDLPECERINERITRLASGIAIIKVGAPTEIEMVEKKHRIEDALEAVKSAQLEGIVPGAGTALIRASKKLKIDHKSNAQKLGADVIQNAVSAPLKQMCLNAGESPDLVLSLVKRATKDHGFNLVDGKIKNLIEDGVIDPVLVTKTALRNANSVASTLITTNFAIVELPETER